MMVDKLLLDIEIHKPPAARRAVFGSFY